MNIRDLINEKDLKVSQESLDQQYNSEKMEIDHPTENLTKESIEKTEENFILLEKLPADILLFVLQYLPVIDLSHIRMLSKAFSEIQWIKTLLNANDLLSALVPFSSDEIFSKTILNEHVREEFLEKYNNIFLKHYKSHKNFNNALIQFIYKMGMDRTLPCYQRVLYHATNVVNFVDKNVREQKVLLEKSPDPAIRTTFSQIPLKKLGETYNNGIIRSSVWPLYKIDKEDIAQILLKNNIEFFITDANATFKLIQKLINITSEESKQFQNDIEKLKEILSEGFSVRLSVEEGIFWRFVQNVQNFEVSNVFSPENYQPYADLLFRWKHKGIAPIDIAHEWYQIFQFFKDHYLDANFNIQNIEIKKIQLKNVVNYLEKTAHVDYLNSVYANPNRISLAKNENVLCRGQRLTHQESGFLGFDASTQQQFYLKSIATFLLSNIREAAPEDDFQKSYHPKAACSAILSLFNDLYLVADSEALKKYILEEFFTVAFRYLKYEFTSTRKYDADTLKKMKSYFHYKNAYLYNALLLEFCLDKNISQEINLNEVPTFNNKKYTRKTLLEDILSLYIKASEDYHYHPDIRDFAIRKVILLASYEENLILKANSLFKHMLYYPDKISSYEVRLTLDPKVRWQDLAFYCYIKYIHQVLKGQSLKDNATLRDYGYFANEEFYNHFISFQEELTTNNFAQLSGNQLKYVNDNINAFVKNDCGKNKVIEKSVSRVTTFSIFPMPQTQQQPHASLHQQMQQNVIYHKRALDEENNKRNNCPAKRKK